jgi:hypothetical protein
LFSPTFPIFLSLALLISPIFGWISIWFHRTKDSYENEDLFKKWKWHAIAFKTLFSFLFFIVVGGIIYFIQLKIKEN